VHGGYVVRSGNYPRDVLSTNRKGAIAETAIVAAATRLGIDVYRPVADGGRYDLIFDTGRLVRVQCKWASRMADVVVVRCYSARRTRDGLVRRTYTGAEIDAFGAYCAELDRCYFVPFELTLGQSMIQLRLAPPLNNQRRGIRWAADFSFEARLRDVQGP
jgi:PD-(D/E)XK endonuclease